MGRGVVPFLRASLREPLSRTVPTSDLSGLAEVAVAHGVPGYAWRLAAAVCLPDPVVDELRDARRWASMHHRATVAALAELGDAFDAAGVAWLVVKGPVLAGHFHDLAGGRLYTDLDLVVAGADLEAALGAMLGRGAEVADDWADLLAEGRAEVRLVTRTGTRVDLHWHLVNDLWLRRSLPLRMSELLDRRRDVGLGDGGLVVPTLDPLDTLLHLAVHTCHSGGHRLLWLKDVERVVRREPPDWREVRRRAEAQGLGLPLAVVLGKVRRALGADVPTGRAITSDAPGWRALARATDRLAAGADVRGRSTPDRLVCRATTRRAADRGRALVAFADLPTLRSHRSSVSRLRRTIAGPVTGPTADPRGAYLAYAADAG